MTTAFYNDVEPYAADWLRNLAADGLITPGTIDSRSIHHVQGTDLDHHTRAHFFAGIGGWDYALALAGWPTDRPVWTGSCPCQPFSGAGKGLGEADPRHLWPEFRRLIGECRPPTIFGEQVASQDGRLWLDRVRDDLQGLGYAVAAADLCSAGIGAPHIRQRLYLVADATSSGLARWYQAGRQDRPQATDNRVDGRMVDADDTGRREPSRPQPMESRHLAAQRASRVDPMHFGLVYCTDGKNRRIEPGTFPMAHRLPRSMGKGSTRTQRMDLRTAKSSRIGQLRGYGNAIDPRVAADFISAFMEAAK